jgi:hypothetical protein
MGEETLLGSQGELKFADQLTAFGASYRFEAKAKGTLRGLDAATDLGAALDDDAAAVRAAAVTPCEQFITRLVGQKARPMRVPQLPKRLFSRRSRDDNDEQRNGRPQHSTNHSRPP